MTDIILWRTIDLPGHEVGRLQRRDDRRELPAAARGSTIASQSLRGKGIASLSRACSAKVRLAKDPYAEGAPGRLGVRWP